MDYVKDSNETLSAEGGYCGNGFLFRWHMQERIFPMLSKSAYENIKGPSALLGAVC